MRTKIFLLIVAFITPISLLSQPFPKTEPLQVSSSCWEPGDLPSQRRYCLLSDGLNEI